MNMEGYFKREDLVGEVCGATYDDLLLRPQLSSIESRNLINTSTSLCNGLELRLPIISSPMSTISGHKMCIEMYKVGGLGVFHRFQSQDNIRVSLEEMSKEIPIDNAIYCLGISLDISSNDTLILSCDWNLCNTPSPPTLYISIHILCPLIVDMGEEMIGSLSSRPLHRLVDVF